MASECQKSKNNEIDVAKQESNADESLTQDVSIASFASQNHVLEEVSGASADKSGARLTPRATEVALSVLGGAVLGAVLTAPWYSPSSGGTMLQDSNAGFQGDARFLVATLLHWVLWAKASPTAALAYDVVCIALVLFQLSVSGAGPVPP